MGNLIVYDDIHVVLKRYLEHNLSIPVHIARVPNPRHQKFILITPSGGSTQSVIHATKNFILDVWVEDDEREAYRLAELAQAYLTALQGVHYGFTIYRTAPIGGIVWLPDAEADIPRFRQNWGISIRGQQITDETAKRSLEASL